MATSAMRKAVSFLGSTIGKKILMALSGLVWFGFTLAHMAGNLQIFLGADAFNGYSIKLHSLPELLWVMRAIMLTAFVVHVATATALVVRTAAARPVGYAKKKNDRTTFAALTMQFSGVTLLFFVFYHIAHFTFPGVAMAAYEHRPYSQVYSNFVNGFSVPWVVALYIAAMISLGFHLYHGAQSLFHTLGFAHPGRSAAVKQSAQFVALTITVGNVILPLSVLLGLVG